MDAQALRLTEERPPLGQARHQSRRPGGLWKFGDVAGPRTNLERPRTTGKWNTESAHDPRTGPEIPPSSGQAD
jgi:hypothetical protein